MLKTNMILFSSSAEDILEEKMLESDDEEFTTISVSIDADTREVLDFHFITLFYT